MADSEIVVATRYTTEGFDAALSKADRIGQRMLRLSRDIGGIGRFLNNDFLIGVSNALGGIEDMIGAVSELSKVIRNMPPLVAGGIIFGGASIVGDAIGKAYNTASGTVDPGTLVSSLQRLQDALNKLPAEQAASVLATFNQRMEGVSSAQRVAGMNALAESIDNIGKSAQKNLPMLSDFYMQQDKLLPRMLQFQKEQSGASYQQFIDQTGAKLKAATTYQDKLASASQKFHADEFENKMRLAELERDITQQRIAAAQSLSADLSRMDSQYYANRLAAAESFGIQAQRDEQDHQRQMRQLQMSHDKRMSKLADSRDALGLEDEIDAYEDERKAAEDEYSVMAARRNQDYANQMRDMERAFQQQRQERINAYNQQLIDIAAYNKAQKELIAQQMQAVAKAVMDAFTQAAKDYTAAQNTMNSTSNTSNVTQNINGANMSPAQYKALTYEAISEVFGASK